MTCNSNPLCEEVATPDFNSRILAAIDTLDRVSAVLRHLIMQQSNDGYGISLILETVLNATTYAGQLLERPEANCSPQNG